MQRATANGGILCHLEDSTHLLEFHVGENRSLSEPRKYTFSPSASIECVALANLNGKETLFVSVPKNSVCSFAFSERGNELIQIGYTEMEDPSLLLWDPQRGELLVINRDYTSTANKVNAVSVSADGRALALLGTWLTSAKKDISSWCRISENAIACFDYCKGQILLYHI